MAKSIGDNMIKCIRPINTTGQILDRAKANTVTGTFIDRVGYELPLLMGLTVMFSSTLLFSLFERYLSPLYYPVLTTGRSDYGMFSLTVEQLGARRTLIHLNG